jgi:hypothetical protein
MYSTRHYETTLVEPDAVALIVVASIICCTQQEKVYHFFQSRRLTDERVIRPPVAQKTPASPPGPKLLTRIDRCQQRRQGISSYFKGIVHGAESDDLLLIMINMLSDVIAGGNWNVECRGVSLMRREAKNGKKKTRTEKTKGCLVCFCHAALTRRRADLCEKSAPHNESGAAKQPKQHNEHFESKTAFYISFFNTIHPKEYTFLHCLLPNEEH